MPRNDSIHLQFERTSDTVAIDFGNFKLHYSLRKYTIAAMNAHGRSRGDQETTELDNVLTSLFGTTLSIRGVVVDKHKLVVRFGANGAPDDITPIRELIIRAIERTRQVVVHDSLCV